MIGRGFVVIFLIVALAGVSYAGTMNEKNIAVCKQLYSEINKKNMVIFDQLMAADFVEHEELPGGAPNKEGVKAFFRMMWAAFPDLTFNPEFYVADEDKVAVYMTINGTQKGEYMGNPATGNQISVTAIDILRFEDGKVVEHWGVTDSMTMMNQLSGGESE